MGNVIGYRFRPTDQELVDHHLKEKNRGNYSSRVGPIPEVDIYRVEPWGLSLGNDGVAYVFTKLEQKQSRRGRFNRRTEAGSWKATGNDREIRAGDRPIGKKRTLVFHVREGRRLVRTGWVMHEYRSTRQVEADFVVCKIKNKERERSVITLSGGGEQRSSMAQQYENLASVEEVNPQTHEIIRPVLNHCTFDERGTLGFNNNGNVQTSGSGDLSYNHDVSAGLQHPYDCSNDRNDDGEVWAHIDSWHLLDNSDWELSLHDVSDTTNEHNNNTSIQALLQHGNGSFLPGNNVDQFQQTQYLNGGERFSTVPPQGPFDHESGYQNEPVISHDGNLPHDVSAGLQHPHDCSNDRNDDGEVWAHIDSWHLLDNSDWGLSLDDVSDTANEHNNASFHALPQHGNGSFLTDNNVDQFQQTQDLNGGERFSMVPPQGPSDHESGYQNEPVISHDGNLPYRALQSQAIQVTTSHNTGERFMGSANEVSQEGNVHVNLHTHTVSKSLLTTYIDSDGDTDDESMDSRVVGAAESGPNTGPTEKSCVGGSENECEIGDGQNEKSASELTKGLQVSYDKIETNHKMTPSWFRLLIALTRVVRFCFIILSVNISVPSVIRFTRNSGISSISPKWLWRELGAFFKDLGPKSSNLVMSFVFRGREKRVRVFC